MTTDAYLETGRMASWPKAGRWARQILVDYVDEVDPQLRNAAFSPRWWNVQWARCRMEQQVQAAEDAPGTGSPVGVQLWAMDLKYWNRTLPVTWWLIDATLYVPTGINEQLVFLRLKLPRRLK